MPIIPSAGRENLTLASFHGTPTLRGGEFERGFDGKTYKGFQGAEQLRDALEASWAKQFVSSKTSTDGEVPQPQQLDVWMVGVVTLVEKQSSVGQLVGFHQPPNSVVWSRRANKRMLWEI